MASEVRADDSWSHDPPYEKGKGRGETLRDHEGLDGGTGRLRRKTQDETKHGEQVDDAKRRRRRRDPEDVQSGLGVPQVQHLGLHAVLCSACEDTG